MSHAQKCWIQPVAVLLSVLVGGLNIQAQRVGDAAFADWALRNQYVAGTDWRSYLTLAPGTMGPNALPVAAVSTARVDTSIRFSLAGAAHTAPGDRSQSLRASVNIPFGRRASLRVRYIGLERYTLTRDRIVAINALVTPGTYLTAGDVHVEGFFQVLQDHQRWPDMVLAIRTKTASGEDLEALRYTDTPAYGFDLAFGKTYHRGDWSWRPFGSGGFYVWQRFGQASPQNDAYTYALGCQVTKDQLALQIETCGYSGWTALADRPILTRGVLRWIFAHRSEAALGISRGWRDYPYTSVSLEVAQIF